MSSLNSLSANNIITMVNTLERRINALEAQIQGAPIDRVRLGTAIIGTAAIADLSITTAKIDTGAVTSAKIANLSADKVTAGTINAGRIGADSITADKLDVDELSAISANFGTITSGSIDGTNITGSVILTSTGDDRIYIAGAQFAFLEDADFRFVAQDNLCYFYGAGIGFAELGGSTARVVVGVSSDLATLVYGSSNIPLILFQALEAELFIGDAETGSISFFGTFQINGSTKTAVVPTSQGYQALYAVESPEVWFFDIAKDIESVDPMFWEVTEGDYKSVTNTSGSVLVFRRRKGYAGVRFETKTKEQFNKNEQLWRQQYAT